MEHLNDLIRKHGDVEKALAEYFQEPPVVKPARPPARPSPILAERDERPEGDPFPRHRMLTDETDDETTPGKRR